MNADGSFDDMNVGEAGNDRVGSQQRLDQFGKDVSYVGVVRYPNDIMDGVVDEYEQRLAPPEELFHQWYGCKQRYEDDGLSDVRAHNAAFEEVAYAPRFDDYLARDEDAQEALDELAGRVVDGEHIVLVCYCATDKLCHREQVSDALESTVRRVVDD